MSDTVQFASIETAVAQIAAGGFVIVMDDESRENEGDLIIAGEFATPERLAFLIRHSTGIVCAAIPDARARELRLPLMVDNNSDPNKTAFTVTIDHKDCLTGVSAEDRALTLQSLADPSAAPADFRRPGHIFPLIAKPGGVRQRRGHTETGVDLCRLAGLAQVGVLSEIQNDDGTMARLHDCAALGAKHGIPVITVDSLVKHCEALQGPYQPLPPTHADTVEEVAMCTLPVERNGEFLGEWALRAFAAPSAPTQIHTVLVKGQLDASAPVAVRVHSECFTGNTLGSVRCDCEDQLLQSLRIINKRGSGVVIYMGGHEGRGIGLVEKIRAYFLQDTQGLDTYQANEALGHSRDSRSYDNAIAIIRKLGIEQVDLLSNNPIKASTLDGLVVRLTPVLSPPTPYNRHYLQAKRSEEAALAQVLFSRPLNNKFDLAPAPVNSIGSEESCFDPKSDILEKIKAPTRVLERILSVVGLVAVVWGSSLFLARLAQFVPL